MWKWIPATVFITASIVVALSVSADQLGSEYGLVESSGVINGDGEVSANIDQAGYYIYDSTQVAQYGGSCASNHALGTGDAIDCNDREINGALYADGGVNVTSSTFMNSNYMGSPRIYIYSTPYVYLNFEFVEDDGGHLSPGSNDGGANRRLIITDFTNRLKNHGHGTLATDPTINQHSVADPTAGDDTQFNEITWNRMALGGDGGGIGCINQTFAYDDLTDGGGAVGTLVLDEGIPDGAVVQQAILHSLTGFTGDTNAAITVGDGTDVDRYNTGTPSVFTTNASGVALGVPSGTIWHDDAKNITVTITTNADYTSVSAGQATILVCYWTP